MRVQKELAVKSDHSDQIHLRPDCLFSVSFAFKIFHNRSPSFAEAGAPKTQAVAIGLR